ncbi:MAG: ABC transporter permease [Chitinispirillales bacterium]|jgi:peptide/nickel transport system permease protein|nr:ABC transporter permease [Chitinispirillales bacterium]
MKNIIEKLTSHKMAFIGGIILTILYAVMFLAEFVAPYHYDSERREHSYMPPTKFHFFDKNGKFHFLPFFYEQEYEFDEYYRRVFVENTDKMYKFCLFAKGERVKLLGILSIDRHLFGADGRIYIIGADSRGRDLFSRIVYGSRVSLTIGFAGVFFSMVIGLSVGAVAGYFGGVIDNILMRICEMIMLIPSFFLLLALRATFPPQLSSVEIYFMIVLILSFVGWAGTARIIRGMTKSISQREFVLAATAIGQNHLTIIFKHVLPQTLSFVVVSLTLSIPSFILMESGLSLIGLGIQDPHASWGNLLSDVMNIADIHMHPWMLIPGGFIFITVMAYNFFGDGLRDVLDPHSAEI